MIKSQLLVCGATTIMHLGTSGKVFLTFHPRILLRINLLMFIDLLIHCFLPIREVAVNLSNHLTPTLDAPNCS